MLDHFPRLKDGGGFQLLKCIPNSRTLEKLSMAVHTSLTLLKQRVGSSRTYIRPLQRDLDLTPVDESQEMVCIHTMCLCKILYRTINCVFSVCFMCMYRS